MLPTGGEHMDMMTGHDNTFELGMNKEFYDDESRISRKKTKKRSDLGELEVKTSSGKGWLTFFRRFAAVRQLLDSKIAPAIDSTDDQRMKTYIQPTPDCLLLLQ